jgi:hypothetical protein
VIGYIGSFYDYEGLDDLTTMLWSAAAPWSRRCASAIGSIACRRPHPFYYRAGAAWRGRAIIVWSTFWLSRKRMRLTELVTPLKPLETAQGRLVAASDVGGHRELIRDGDTGRFQAAIPKILHNRWMPCSPIICRSI